MLILELATFVGAVWTASVEQWGWATGLALTFILLLFVETW